MCLCDASLEFDPIPEGGLRFGGVRVEVVGPFMTKSLAVAWTAGALLFLLAITFGLITPSSRPSGLTTVVDGRTIFQGK